MENKSKLNVGEEYLLNPDVKAEFLGTENGIYGADHMVFKPKDGYLGSFGNEHGDGTIRISLYLQGAVLLAQTLVKYLKDQGIEITQEEQDAFERTHDTFSPESEDFAKSIMDWAERGFPDEEENEDGKQ